MHCPWLLNWDATKTPLFISTDTVSVWRCRSHTPCGKQDPLHFESLLLLLFKKPPNNCSKILISQVLASYSQIIILRGASSYIFSSQLETNTGFQYPGRKPVFHCIHVRRVQCIQDNEVHCDGCRDVQALSRAKRAKR